jgi:hypothetical protein
VAGALKPRQSVASRVVATVAAIVVGMVIAAGAVAIWPSGDTGESQFLIEGAKADAHPAVGIWASLSPGAGADEVERYETLGDMTSGASLTVVGVVESVEPGRMVGEDSPAQYILATLRVDSVLAGDGAHEGETVPLEFGPVEPGAADDPALDPIVGDEGLFFLRLKGEGSSELGTEEVEEEKMLGLYRVVSSQGLFINDAGNAKAALYVDSEGFPKEIHGAPFESLVSGVEARGA